MTPPLSLFLVQRKDPSRAHCESFRSFVVAAASEQDASRTIPGYYAGLHTRFMWRESDGVLMEKDGYGIPEWAPVEWGTWVESLADVEVVLLGTAAPDIVAGILCADFQEG